MGAFLKKSCYTNKYCTSTPNPNPSRWHLLEIFEFKNGYVMIVKYHDCTNFEGVKVMVFKGEYVKRDYLDPHFTTDDRTSPIARFKPTEEGIEMAKNLAAKL